MNYNLLILDKRQKEIFHQRSMVYTFNHTLLFVKKDIKKMKKNSNETNLIIRKIWEYLAYLHIYIIMLLT